MTNRDLLEVADVVVAWAGQASVAATWPQPSPGPPPVAAP